MGEELLLNAVALEFIMSMDELTFAVLAPEQLQGMVRSTAPFKMLPWPHWRGADVKAAVLPLMFGACTAWVWFARLSPMVKNLEEVNSVMCDGWLQFSYLV